MQNEDTPKWAEITREERFFTSLLFNDIKNNVDPFRNVLLASLGLPPNLAIVDVGYEVCFFRDAAHAKLIDRCHQREKQTFDLMLFVENKILIIIEAKANQCNNKKQLDNLHDAIKLICKNPKYPIQNVYIYGLWSSKYSPRQQTLKKFHRYITWKTIAELYPHNKKEYYRADEIYND